MSAEVCSWARRILLCLFSCTQHELMYAAINIATMFWPNWIVLLTAIHRICMWNTHAVFKFEPFKNCSLVNRSQLW